MAIIVKDAVKKYGQGESEIYALNHAGLEIEGGRDLCDPGAVGFRKEYLPSLHQSAGAAAGKRFYGLFYRSARLWPI